MEEKNRLLLTNLNRKTISFMGTSNLNAVLEDKAKEYSMKKSAFIRALLENIDEANLWKKIMGDS